MILRMAGRQMRKLDTNTKTSGVTVMDFYAQVTET